VHVNLIPADEAELVRRHPELKPFGKDGHYVLRLGDLVGPANAIATACQHEAPTGLWQGIAQKTGTLGIT
jgi:hypothetical protein